MARIGDVIAMRLAWLVAPALACGEATPAPAPHDGIATGQTRATIALPAPEAPHDSGTDEVAPQNAPDGGPDAGFRAPLDVERAPVVEVAQAPTQAVAPHPVGSKPAKDRMLKLVKRVADTSALTPQTTYDPRRAFEMTPGGPPSLPAAARPDIPMHYRGLELRIISESGGKLLLNYGGRYLAVVDGSTVEHVVDTCPASLPITAAQRDFHDFTQVELRDSVAFVCSEYNSWVPSRKGIVTAIDVTNGEVRWRSERCVCGGVLVLMGDYVVTGYGDIDKPYAIKLLRVADGTTVQSITQFGAAILFEIQGDDVTAGTFKERVTYRLQP
jgi:hypothetical protein